jgi:glycosyltransferase involved in cell wall biosynthesis
MLVSILIPAYRPTYFLQALNSAKKQTYKNCEIIVCDDSEGDEIREMCNGVEYHSNHRKGARKNYRRCFDLARGEYIKFLNDDDLLHSTCVEKMLGCFDENITLVTSHRKRIDKDGKYLGEAPYTQRPAEKDITLRGKSVCEFLAKEKLNFIGEPSTTMFRKKDMDLPLFSINGAEIASNGDAAMWMKLLMKGNLYYIHETLSGFREHTEQRQQQEDFLPLAIEGWIQIERAWNAVQ